VTNELPEGLLVHVQRGLESLYALEHEPPVTDFLIPEEDASSYPGGGSRTLVTQEGDEVALGVVIDRSVEHCLAHSDPRKRLDAENLQPFCTVTEEVSHFLYLLFCARFARSTTKLELELQGEVDKYLTSVFFLSLQNEGAVSFRLRDLLFRHYHFSSGLTSEESERYRTASDLAYRYCGYLEDCFLRPARLLDLARESRRFYRLGQREKLEKIAALPPRIDA
jgi:hypothetical protein